MTEAAKIVIALVLGFELGLMVMEPSTVKALCIAVVMSLFVGVMVGAR